MCYYFYCSITIMEFYKPKTYSSYIPYLSLGLVLFLIEKSCGGVASPTIESVVNNSHYESWDSITLWPDGVITYRLPDNMYEVKQTGSILSAMRRWEQKTCVKFVPWSNQIKQPFSAVRYIEFYGAGSCFSKNGMYKDQPQLIGIGKSCLQITTVMHELGHAIGKVHEMERNDRDLYIDIKYENINPSSVRNFDTIASKKSIYNLYGTPYDYKSIMHYDSMAWSSNSKPVMVTRDPAYQQVIGNADDISFFDASYVNIAYNCSARCTQNMLRICQNGGIVGGSDCRCICQDGYDGEFCETPLPGYDKIIEWKCQKGWIFHAGKCYLFKTEETLAYSRVLTKCQVLNSSLVIVKKQSDMVWINAMVKEKRLMTNAATFWIGISRMANNSNVMWKDGSPVDTNIISLVDDTLPLSQYACARYDGQIANLSGCEQSQDNGYICQKAFDPSCGGRYVLSGSAITIQSPGFPVIYPNDILCNYVIQTGRNSRIKLRFDYFQLDTNCNNDFVELLLSNDATQTRQRFCGAMINNRTFESDGNLIIITFNTDSRFSYVGFNATLEEIQPILGSTPPSLSFLETLRNTLSSDKENRKSNTTCSMLSGLYELFKSFTFSKL